MIPFKWRDDGGEGRVTQFYQNGGLDCFGCLSHRTVIRLSLFMPTNTYKKRHGSFGSGANFSRWNCLNKRCNLQMTCQAHFSPSRCLLSLAPVSFMPVFFCVVIPAQTSLIEGVIVPVGRRFHLFYSVPSQKRNLGLCSTNKPTLTRATKESRMAQDEQSGPLTLCN